MSMPDDQGAFIPDTSANLQGVDTSAVDQGVAPEASAVPDNVQNSPAPDPRDQLISQIQSERDRLKAQTMDYEYRMRRLEEQYQQQMQPQNSNVYVDPKPDPNQDWEGYNRWLIRQELAPITNQIQQSQRQFVEGLTREAEALTFKQRYPMADINEVRRFAQMRGIQLLEDAYAIMTLPETINGVRRNASQNTINQFRNTNNGIPSRPSSGGAPPPDRQEYKSFAALAERVRRDPRYYDTLPDEVKIAFDREVQGYMNS